MQKPTQASGRKWFRRLLRITLQPKTNVNANSRKNRQIKFEPLESRQLMAADFFADTSHLADSLIDQNASASAYYAQQNQSAGNSLNGEGEDGAVAAGANLVEFAKLLQQAGVRFYGADWCPLCTQQKDLFQDGKSYLPFIEMTNPDRTRNAEAIAENVTEYPTWEFNDGSRLTGVQSLETLATRAGITIPMTADPSFVTIPTQTVQNRSPLHIPVDAYSPSGEPLTITVTSSNPSVISAEMVTNNKSLRMVVNGYGEMVFRLFADEASRPVSRIEQLVNSGFYNETATNKIIFHRVIDSFMIQTGDPTGTGSGGSSLPDFDDQYNVNLQHNRSGVLSYAKSSDDTNDSQFFITEVATRHLDFNHSIFGQLVEGDSVREGISRTRTGTGDRPTNEISIKSAEIFNDTENGLIRLKAIANTGTATITVTVTDASGRVSTQQFTANAAADTANGGPFLSDITVPAEIPAGAPFQLQLNGVDKEGDAIFYEAVAVGSVPFGVAVNSQTGLLTVTPPAGYSGALSVRVAAKPASGSSSTGDPSDVQTIVFNVVNQGAVAPTVDLSPDSDAGVSDTDNITNATSMTFNVSGITAGATVNLRVGNDVIETVVATGTTVTITTNKISAMGAGTRSVTVTQTVGGETSNPSAPLSVTYDSTPPDAIITGQLPGFAKVNTPLAFDLAHGEEGQSLRYSIESGPAGMTVDPNTGVLSWTPTLAQAGNQIVRLGLTDLAGNERIQQFTIVAVDQALVSIRLVPSDADGNPIAMLTAGQDFFLRVLVTDLRTGGTGAGQGVFSAYMDIEYDPNIFELRTDEPIIYNGNFANSRLTPNLSVAGVINELGAFSSFTAGPGREPQVLAAIAMRAKANGQGNISANPSETPHHGMAVFGVNGLIPNDLVNFVTANVAVGQDFIAVDDTFNFDEDSHNNVLNVLANDVITTGSGVTLTIDTVGTTSKGGSVTIAPDGKTLVYAPAANFNGVETFTYTVKDGTGKTGTATVTVQVNPVNDNPIANNDTITGINAGQQNVFLNVLANDTMGPDTGETLVVSTVGTPSQGGTATVASAGTGILYTPKAGFTGSETITYTISDGRGGTATATVTVVVGSNVPPPTVANEAYTIVEDAAVAEFDVLANDTPAATGDTLTITQVTAPNGIASITSNGTKLSYAPKANFSGTDLVVYTVKSSNGGTALATATFTVTAVNDPPNAVDDVLDVLSQPNQTVDVLKNDINPDQGENQTITAVTQPAAGQGTVQIAADGKSLIYNAPNTSFTGTVTFTYTLSDGTSTDTANVTLTVRDYIPRDVGVVFKTNVQGVPITVEYSALGSTAFTAVNASKIQYTSNGVKVLDVGPGQIRFSVGNLPFHSGAANSIVVNSGATDGDSLDTLFDVGTRDAKFFDLRDFTGKNLANGITAAVSANQSAHWYQTNGAWQNYRNVSVTMNSAGTQLTVKATNNANQPVQSVLNVTDSRVQVQAQDDGASLIRLRTAPAQLFATTTPPAANSSASTESANAAASSSATPAADNSAASTNSGSDPLSLDDLLAGEGEATAAPVNYLSPEMVDQAMASEQSSEPAEELVTNSLRSFLGSSLQSNSNAQETTSRFRRR